MIGVETQTVMLNIPADPGMPDSMERTIPQVSCFPEAPAASSTPQKTAASKECKSISGARSGTLCQGLSSSRPSWLLTDYTWQVSAYFHLCIAVSCRSKQQGNPNCLGRQSMCSLAQAGQVWFPDSALKTAQAIEEFDREQLPLIIMANWRGFSGGQRDLFEGVLQVHMCLCSMP